MSAVAPVPATPLEHLAATWAAFCAREGIEPMCAEEAYVRPGLTGQQRARISFFCTAWTIVEAIPNDRISSAWLTAWRAELQLLGPRVPMGGRA